ncbi:MAG: MFS transporter [bacterium]
MNRTRWVFHYLFTLFLTIPPAIFMLATPLKIKSLGGTEMQAGQTGTAFSITFAIVAIFAGILSDKLGRKTTMAAGILITVVPCLFMLSTTSIGMMILGVVLFGIGNATVIPTTEAWVADRASGPISREMMAFNLGWSSGWAIGYAITGFMTEHGYVTSYLTAAGISFALAMVVLGTKSHIDTKEIPVMPNADALNELIDQASIIEAKGRLYSVWIANMALFFSWAIVVWLFPGQAEDLGLPHKTIGLLMSLVLWIQMVLFFVLSFFSEWHLSLAVRAGFQIAAILGFLMLAVPLAFTSLSTTLVTSLFAAGLLFFGLGKGGVYSASLIVSVEDEKSRGSKAGTNETLLGAGTVFGPIVAGYTAIQVGQWSIYFLSILVVLISMAIQLKIRHSVRKKVDQLTPE